MMIGEILKVGNLVGNMLLNKVGDLMKNFLKIIFSVILAFSLCSCNCSVFEYRTFGVWWWDDTLDSGKYFEFAKDNGVNEIYYCSDDFDENTSQFIEKAKKENIKVYFLAGEYEWLSDSSNLYNKINAYVSYQKKFSNKFSGIHLDIEPHQNPEFDNNREELISNLIKLANSLKNKYPDITFDYDLPFWLNDEISFNGQNKEAYKHMIDVADRVFLMSYRDSADAIYEVSKDEIEYAQSVDKVLVLGLETKSNEGDKVSFQEEGKGYMYSEIINLWKLVPSGFGVTIHHIKSWYDLSE